MSESSSDSGVGGGDGVLVTPFRSDVFQYTSSPQFRKETMESGKFFEVISILLQQGLINPSHVKDEAEWYFFKLGIHVFYFKDFEAKVIADHLTQLHAARILARAQVTDAPIISVTQEDKDSALYFCNSISGARSGTIQGVEARLEQMYLDQDTPYRLLTYRSLSPVFEKQSIYLRLQFIQRANFKSTTDDGTIESIADEVFLTRASERTKKIYNQLVQEAKQTFAPASRIVWEEVIHEGAEPFLEAKVIIAFRRRFVSRFYSNLTPLYHYYGLTTLRKYVEPMANGISILALVLRPSPTSTAHLSPDMSLQDRVSAFAAAVTDLFVLPTSDFHTKIKDFTFSVNEVLYLNAGWKYCYYFLRRYHQDWKTVVSVLDQTNPAHAAILSRLRNRLGQTAATERSLSETLNAYPELVKTLYRHFCALHCPYDFTSSSTQPEPRTMPSREEIEKYNEEIRTLLLRFPFEAGDDSEFDQQVFQCLHSFNNSILKTNFFLKNKVALSFRMNTESISLLSFVDRPPFGYFMFVGGEFRGFHLRFQDMARGGVRIVKSPNREAYNRNMASLLEENYNLAHTQQRKNKDIPEGGSKGTILLTYDKERCNPFIAFQKYVDCMLDVLMPTQVFDYYGKEEVLFLGPDEGTAEYMHWASTHAKMRGYKFWRAFTTGKPTDLGGIPHDVFGMTTRSVHQYVLGALRKAGIREEECTKFQTGGPDGDLGSNEIKISHDKTTAVVDGSGVLVDPEGINREELLRLANSRKMICHFDRSKLSPKGYVVLVEDKGVKLPNGEEIESGLLYRNTFHLLPASSATLFVPCGGRPNAVSEYNVEHLFYEGVPRFRFIIEGANLFFTQPARLQLEQAGVVLFKDASANKGGVTSSSLEVLAALAFGNDEKFETHMCVAEGQTPPQFYLDYVTYVQSKIEENARLECELIIRENEKTKTPQCVLSDQLSEKINNMKLQIFQSELYRNIALRDKILKKSLPPLLIDLVGYDVIIERVPAAYLQSIFATYIAAHFVYECGLSTTSEFTFYEFMSKLN